MADGEIEKQKTSKKGNPAWVKGVSGNPAGRPKLQDTVGEAIRKAISAEEIAQIIIGKAREGDRGAEKYIEMAAHYHSGKPREYVPMQDEDETAKDGKVYKLYKRLHAKQKAVIDQLENGDKYIVNQWSRRTGKTELNASLIAWAGARWPDAEITYIHLTAKNAFEQVGKQSLEIMNSIGLGASLNASKGTIEFGTGGRVYFVGNESKDEREKMLGFGKNRRLVILDECQSQKELRYVLTEKLLPTLMDCGAALVLSGTKARVRGTYWGDVYGNSTEGKRINFANLFDNPFIKNPQETLERILGEHGLSINDSVVRREFFNEDVYDDEALVLRVKEHNYYDDDGLKEWLETYGATVRAVLGLDLGYEDADAVCVLLYSDNDERVWNVYEEVCRRQGVGDTVAMCNRALAEAGKYTQAKAYIMADMGGLGKKIAEDMFYVHKLPIMPAEKSAKEAAIENLQQDVSTGRFKTRKGGAFDIDSMKLVYERNELDQITRIVDDSVYHSDIIDATLYAHREAIKHTAR